MDKSKEKIQKMCEQLKSEAIPTSTETKLDQDFLFYLNEGFTTFDSAKLKEKDKFTVEIWLDRLMKEPAISVEKKKLRNIYFLQLLNQMKDGKFDEVFNKKPPDGPLQSPSEVFSDYKRTRHLCPTEMVNTDMSPIELSHTSKDNRTYLACKAVPDNGGACGYLAVSNGGGDTLWLNAEGAPLVMPERKDLTVRYPDKNTDMFFVENPEASLLKLEEDPELKEKMNSFYFEVLDGISSELENIRKNPGWYNGIKSDVVRRLANQILVEISGKDDRSADSRTVKAVLYALRSKIKDKILVGEEDANKDETFEDPEIKFIDATTKILPVDDQEIWCEALQLEPEEESVNLLYSLYPQCLVNAVLKLLDKQKGVIIEQEQFTYDNVIAEITDELLTQVKEGLYRYQIARAEWLRNSKIKSDILSARERVMKSLKNDKSDDSFSEIEAGYGDHVQKNRELCVEDSDRAFIKEEMKLAEMNYAEALRKNEILESKIQELRERITNLNEIHVETENSVKGEEHKYLKMVERMKNVIEKQEQQIDRLLERKRKRDKMLKARNGKTLTGRT